MRSLRLAASVLVLAACAAPTLSSATPAPAPSRASTTERISRDQAVAVARDALQEAGEDWDVVLADAGQLGEVRPGWEEYEWAQGLSADLPVWRVVMVAGELSAEVVIDSGDGSVYGSIIGIAN
jgi:hypothetical protein